MVELVSRKSLFYGAAAALAVGGIALFRNRRKGSSSPPSITAENAESEDLGRIFTVKSPSGAFLFRVAELGAILTSVQVEDRDGRVRDVVLGFDSIKQCKDLGNPAYFGCVVGRVANRIAGGRFELGGKEYQVNVNQKPNCLHGGLTGLDKKIWKGEICEHKVVLRCISEDGEEGFPGRVEFKVEYSLVEDAYGQYGIKIQYFATTDKPTIVNLTNHTYFNLSGHASGSVLDHTVQIFADFYTPVDSNMIPTGEILPVKNSPLDFNRPKTMRSDLKNVFQGTRGFDHNFVLKKRKGKNSELAAKVYCAHSGIGILCYTTMPGLQLYGGNWIGSSLSGLRLKDGALYGNYSGFCLETQYFPDACNHPNFPSIELHPGQEYNHETTYMFSNSPLF